MVPTIPTRTLCTIGGVAKKTSAADIIMERYIGHIPARTRDAPGSTLRNTPYNKFHILIQTFEIYEFRAEIKEACKTWNIMVLTSSIFRTNRPLLNPAFISVAVVRSHHDVDDNNIIIYVAVHGHRTLGLDGVYYSAVHGHTEHIHDKSPSTDVVAPGQIHSYFLG